MISLLLKYWKTILSCGLLLAVLGLGISLLFPKQYSAESQLLIITQDRYGVDPYTQAKAAERIGENLTQIMATADFYNKVMSSGQNFNRDVWNNMKNERERRKQWQKNVQASVVYGTSLMRVAAYAASAEEATALNNAVAKTITNSGWEYAGGDVMIKIVSDPLASRWYARPNFFMNGLLGLLVGVFLSALWVIRYKTHHVFGS